MVTKDELIAKYIYYCIEQEKNESMPAIANKAYDKKHEVFKKLREQGRLSEIEPLLDHENMNVQTTSAAYFLLVDEQKAKKKLSEIARQGGIRGMEAEAIMTEWDKGSLSFNY